MGALEFGEINELVKTARTRYSEVVSVALSQVGPELTALPANLQAWHAWGSAVTQMNAADQKGG